AVLDSTSIARIAADRRAARTVAGSGPYRIASWVDGDNVVLERAAPDPTPEAVTKTLVIRWTAEPAARAAELKDASVDGMDAPGPTELEAISTLPELVVTPRAGMATAFLAFGSGPAFAGTRVRRALALSIDRAALVDAAFPAGSLVPAHVIPCAVVGGCGGRAWYDFNGPAAVAALADEQFDLEATYPLHVPDQPVPGLPDPVAVANALRDQLAANIGLTVTVDVMPLAAFRKAVGAGSLAGLYLDGVASSLADPVGFLGPLFGDDVRTTPARRATAVKAAVASLASVTDPQGRADAVGVVNDAIRSVAVMVPLANPGSVVAFHGDVTGVSTSAMGLDPLGSATPGDRPQLVFTQATEPDGAYCGDQASPDALRLCGLVTQGLFGFESGTLARRPILARTCDPSPDATVWTCTLRSGRTFTDGMAIDAGDVLASFVAQWDRTQPLRAAEPEAPFAAWDELFGGTLDG
ncbi:MAG: ABC transporter substrate-binding protein, partial [Candidatus Limnocylindrales bacterium]